MRFLPFVFAAVAGLLFSSVLHGASLSSLRKVDGGYARRLVQEVVASLTARSLPPRDELEYKEALEAVRAASLGDFVDESMLYRRIQSLLETIDSDGHSQLIRREDAAKWNKIVPPTGPDLFKEQAYISGDASRGKVLVLRPPQFTVQGETRIAEAADHFLGNVRESIGYHDACGLVVDLSAQVGGNAWPVLLVLADLVTDYNTSLISYPSRIRTPLVSRDYLDSLVGKLRSQNQGVLAKFRDTPIGIVITGQTASAGEMIAFVLKGERLARTFGSPSGGSTTVNDVVTLFNGDVLLVSVARYAYKGQLELRGKIFPDVELPIGSVHGQIVEKAASWVRAASGCNEHPVGEGA